jgi:uncharacterized repeat protein (TIGR01451 family)/fimbrial isopeptide formation D2 family protein
VTHPLTGAAVACALGQQLIVLQLPFGSFTASQPPAPLTVIAALSGLADVGTPLSVTATPGFAYGNSPTGNTPVIGAAATATLTPQAVRFTKTYIGPELETATGPNYPRRFRLSVDVATGVQVNNLAITDLLPPQYAFLAVTSIGPAGSVNTQTPTVGGVALAPDNDLVRTWAGPLTGTGATEDAFVEFQYFIPDIAATPAVILDAATGDDAATRNDGKTSGTVHPKDVRDPDQAFLIDPNTTGGSTPDDVQVIAKSIAVQKSVSIAVDNGASGASPGDVLQYTISGQVSDYFTFAGITVADLLSDGQTFIASTTPTLTITEDGVTTATDLAGNTSVDESQRTACGDGATRLGFAVSNAYLASGAILGQGGIFTGGRVNIASGPATFTITFRATIDDRYRCTPAVNDALDPNDHVENTVTVNGEILNNLTQAPQAVPQFEADGSATSVTIRNGALSKSIYARNGVIGGGSGSPVQFAAFDTITYRLHFDMPSTDITSFKLADYLPLPVLTAIPLTQTVGACTTPAAGQWCYGPADTFHSLPGAPTPTVAADAVGNSLTWNYGTYQDPGNQTTTMELLFTLRVSDSPFRDGLFLTNQVQATYNNSFGIQQTTPAIVQIELTEPNVRLLKGVVDSDSPVETYTGTRNPTGVTFGAVGASCPGFSPATLNSANLNNAPNANTTGVDADDIVRFAIVVENTGKGLNGAFDVAVSDTLPAGFSIPPTGLKLCVTNGLGASLAHTDTGFFTGTPSTGPNTGTITLTDGATGALRPDNATRTSGTNLAVISYELKLDPTVAVQTALTNTATITRFAASEGGPDFTPLLPTASKTDTAVVTTRTPGLAKVLSATNQTHTTGNNVAIGEVATYKVDITVPEGQALNARLVDTLPTGLAITSIDSITASTGLTSSVGTMATVLATTQAAMVSPGRPLTVNFGTLTNSDTNDAVAETITIFYRAVVLDDIGNQQVVPAVNLNNSARFTYTSGGSATRSAAVTVVEPTLSVSKTASPANADAGDTVTYTILIQPAAGSNLAAFNVSLTDLLPASVNYVPGSLTSTGGVAPTTLSDAAAPTFTATWNSFPAVGSSTITYRATIPANAVAPASVVNTARLTWTSLPTGGDPVSPFNTAGRERTGANGPGAGLDNYAATSSATVNITAAALTKSLVSTSAASTTAADVTIGEQVTYDLRVTLPEGSIPAGFSVTDVLPPGLKYVAGSAQVITTGFNGTLPAPVISGGAADGDDVVLTFGASSVTANNNAADDSFTVRLAAVASDVASNVGLLPGQVALDNLGRIQLVGGTPVNSGLVRVTVVEPHMDISKTVSPTVAVQGQTITVSFVVENNGLSDAFDVAVQDVLDASYNAATAAPLSTPSGFVYSRSGNTITYSGGTIPFGQSRTFTMTVALVSPLAAGTVVPNTATVTDATTLPGTVTGERNEPDATSQAVLNTVAADLVLSKDDGVDTVVPGQQTTYQLVVTNVGGAPATGVHIDDTLPPGTTFVGVGGVACSDGGIVLGARRINVAGTIVAAGGTVTCTLTLTIDSPAAAGTAGYFNDAIVADDGTHGIDPTPDNNLNDDNDTLVGHVPDVQVTKYDGVQLRAPGETYHYTIDVTNSGNIGVTNVLVEDTLPAGLSFVSCTSTSGAVSIACSESSGVVSITYAGLVGGGGHASFQIEVTVDSPAAAGLREFVNVVTVTDDGANGTDANPANNLGTDTDELDAAPDMRLTKLASTNQAAPGDAVTYTLLVANEGSQDATGVTVVDQAPTGLTISCATAVPASTTCDGRTITWGTGLADNGVVTGGTFRAARTRTLAYQAIIDTPAVAGTTSLRNTAGVDDDHLNGLDPTPENNTSEAVVTLTGAAPDLRVTKTDHVASARPGDALTYDITVVNNGNIGATGIVVTDTVPAELAFVGCPALPVACDASSLPLVRWTIPLLAGGGASFQVQYDAVVVQPLASGITQTTNTVVVVDDGTNGADPTPNNTATDTDTLVAAPDLDIRKNDGVQVRQPGEEFDYTLVVRNKGDQGATSVEVVDTLPSELAFVSCPATPVGCTASGEDVGGTVTWIVGSLPGGATLPTPTPGSTVTLTLRVRVAPGAAANVSQIQNRVVVNEDGLNGPDPTPGDNRDADVDTLDVVPDMAVTKTDGATTARPGDTLAYVISVENHGTQAATGVTVDDTLPAGVTFVSCTPACDSSALPVLTWSDLHEDTPGTVSDATGFDPAGIATLTVIVTVDDPVAAGIDTLTNTVDVTDDGLHGVDPFPGDNTATDVDTLDAVPDLMVTKDDGVDSVVAGDTIDYTITVTNIGDQTATGVVATDTMPAGTSFVSCTDACNSSAAPTVVWTSASLASGASVVHHLLLAIDDPIAIGITTFDNTVTVADDGTNGVDPTPANNTDVDSDTFGVDLGVTKTDGLTEATPGEAVTYTIAVTNHGTSTIGSFTLADTVPAALTGVTFAASRGSYDSTTQLWTGLQPFTPGQSVTLTVRGTIDPAATGQLVNTVRVSPPAGYPDRVPGNNTATDTDTLVPWARLALEKDLLTPLFVGQQARYRMTVTNSGPSEAHQVTVVDDLPDSLTPTGTVAPGWTCNVAGGVARCSLDTPLAPNQSASFEVMATVEANGGSTIVNQARAESSTPGVGGGSNTATDDASGSVAGSGGGLPATGGNVLDLLAIAAQLLVVGWLMTTARRRRRSVA